MERDLTATVFIIKNGKVLLHPHEKFGTLLPPGGHVEKNETPCQAALREVEEESGLIITLLKEEHLWLKEPNAISLHRPYLCLLEKIPATQEKKAHEHIDFIFLAEPLDNKEPLPPFQWYFYEDIENLSCPEKIFPDTKQIIYEILKNSNLYQRLSR